MCRLSQCPCVCPSPGRPRDVSLATEGSSAPDGPRCLGSEDGPDGERGIPDASGSDRGRPHTVPRKMQNHKQFPEPVGRKDVTSPPRSQARAWPSPGVDVGACPSSTVAVWRGQGQAIPKPREMARCKQEGIKCQLCSASLLCAHPMQWEIQQSRARRTWHKKIRSPECVCPAPLSRVWWWWRNGKCGRWMELEKRGADDGLGLVEPDSPIPRFQLFPLFPLGPSGPLASPHVLLRSSYPSLSVIGSGGWLARGWLLDPLCFFCLCLFDCRGCCIDESGARHGTTTGTPPNLGHSPA